MKYFLTDKDRREISALLAAFRGRPSNTIRGMGNPLDHEEFPAPEVYVALTPVGGIPALNPTVGTGSLGAGDIPGTAECDIYNIISSDGSLQPIEGLSKTVLNISNSAIDGDSWILITRSKGGRWFAVPTAVGGTTTSSEGPVRSSIDYLDVGYSFSSTMTAMGLQLSLPAGRWLITLIFEYYAKMTTSDGLLYFDMYNSTGAAILAQTQRTVHEELTGEPDRNNVVLQYSLNNTTGGNITVQGRVGRREAGETYDVTAGDIYGSSISAIETVLL